MSEKNIAQSYKSYIIGFVASAILTLASYFTVIGQIFDRIPIIIAIVTFAIAQLVFQLIYFLHMGDEEKPRWNLYSFIFSINQNIFWLNIPVTDIFRVEISQGFEEFKENPFYILQCIFWNRSGFIF